MPAILLTPPAAEPITLADAKSFLRVTTDDDDAVIAALIGAARGLVEAQTRRALVTQTWRLVLDAWPRAGRIAVVPSPLRALVAARVRDGQGSPHAIDLQGFIVEPASVPPNLGFAPWSMPEPGQAIGGIEIDFTAGYGDAPADVPEPLRQAIRLLVAHWYEHRGLVAVGHAVAVLPGSIAALLAPYRVLAL